MNLEIKVHFTDILWDDEDFIEYAILSVGNKGIKDCFRALANLNKDADKQFDLACKFMFGEIQNSCIGFGNGENSVHRSFTYQVYALITHEGKLKEFYKRMPETLKSKDCELNVFHRLLITFIASLFQSEFIWTLDQLLELDKNGTAPQLEYSLDEHWNSYLEQERHRANQNLMG
jgi:hypothetical protein